MKKENLLYTLIFILGTSASSFAQLCCNVVDGSGMKVVTTNGVCVKAPNLLAMNVNCDAAPDSDGDGISDKDDHCPNEKGTEKNYGCPDLNEDEVKVLKDALEGVNFEFGNAVLTTESKPKLDNVAELLSKHASFKIKVSGYTDSSGADDLNLALSKKRAASVKEYLISDGVASSRIQAEGYGEANPIADNETEEGRAKNRRVEFKIVY